MDDDLDLLGGSEGPGGPERPPWMLVTGIVLVALLTLVGVGWMVTSVVGGGGTVTAAGPATPSAPPTTAPSSAPSTARAAETSAFPTALPTTTRPPVPTYSVPVVPVPSAIGVAPTTPRVTPRATTPPPTPRVPPPAAGLRTVPDVVGLKVRSATAVLKSAGFRVSVLGGLFAPDRDARRVTAQQPTAGSKARAGSIVILLTDGL